MKKLSLFSKAILSLAVAAALVGCSVEAPNVNTEASNVNAETSSLNTETSSLNTETSSLNPEDSSGNTEDSSGNTETPTEVITAEATADVISPEDLTGQTLRVGSLKGPTSIGLAKLINVAVNHLTDDAVINSNGLSYEFNIQPGAEQLLSSFIADEIDAALIPANAAAIWYKKFTDESTGKSEITVVDINTLGVLYMVGLDETAKSEDAAACFEAMKGKTIYLTGKGTTVQYVLEYLMKENGYSPDDFTLEYKSEATEVVAALSQAYQDEMMKSSVYGLLPQPYVTIAQNQIEGLDMLLSLSDAWDACGNSGRQVTGVTVVRTSYLEAHPEVITQLICDHSASVNYVNANPDEASEMIVEAGIIEKAPIAKKALPYCSLVCITGEEMKEALSGYLNVLYESDPTSVGGALPKDDFYYIP